MGAGHFAGAERERETERSYLGTSLGNHISKAGSQIMNLTCGLSRDFPEARSRRLSGRAWYLETHTQTAQPSPTYVGSWKIGRYQAQVGRPTGTLPAQVFIEWLSCARPLQSR